MFKEFAKDIGARYLRTALQILFTSIMVGGVQIIDEDTANQLTGAILLVLSLIPTALSAWKASRAAKAAKLLNAGATAEAKMVAAGQKSA